jgi:hypothetical protein
VEGGRSVLTRLATAALLVVLAIIGSPLPPSLFAALVLGPTVLESLHGEASSLGKTNGFEKRFAYSFSRRFLSRSRRR